MDTELKDLVIEKGKYNIILSKATFSDDLYLFLNKKDMSDGVSIDIDVYLTEKNIMKIIKYLNSYLGIKK